MKNLLFLLPFLFAFCAPQKKTSYYSIEIAGLQDTLPLTFAPTTQLDSTEERLYRMYAQTIQARTKPTYDTVKVRIITELTWDGVTSSGVVVVVRGWKVIETRNVYGFKVESPCGAYAYLEEDKKTLIPEDFVWGSKEKNW